MGNNNGQTNGNINTNNNNTLSNGSNVNRSDYLGSKIIANGGVVGNGNTSIGLIEGLNGGRMKIKENIDKHEEKYIIPSNRSSPSVLTEGRRQRKPKVRKLYSKQTTS